MTLVAAASCANTATFTIKDKIRLLVSDTIIQEEVHRVVIKHY